MRVSRGATIRRRESGPVVGGRPDETPERPGLLDSRVRGNDNHGNPDLPAEFLDENLQSNLGACSRDAFGLREYDKSVQRAPQHFGQKFRLSPI